MTTTQPCLSVWATGQPHPPRRRTSRALYGIPSALAAHAITTYTRPGQLVLDPSCDDSSVVGEALTSGRHALGLTTSRRAWHTTRAQIAAAHRAGAPGDGLVLLHTPEALPLTRLTSLPRRAHLLLTTIHPSTVPTAATEADPPPLPSLARLLHQCQPLLHPDGHVIVTARPHRVESRLLDLPGAVLAAGRAAGFHPVDHCIALHAELRGTRLIPRASRARRRSAAHHSRKIGHPVTVTVHDHVLIFRTPSQPSTHTAALDPPHHGPSATPPKKPWEDAA